MCVATTRTPTVCTYQYIGSITQYGGIAQYLSYALVSNNGDWFQ